jgi:hypothetical protein
MTVFEITIPCPMILRCVTMSALLAAASLAGPLSQTPAQVAGRWDITIQFVQGRGNYTAFFEQEGERLTGTFRGQFLEGELEGTTQQEKIQFQGILRIEGTRLFYDFTGSVGSEEMSGTVAMGEYGEASWTAKNRRR